MMSYQPTAKIIDAESFQAEAANFFNENGRARVLTHAEILNVILDAINEIDFHAIAGLEKGDPLPQKHLIVICINELLKMVK